MRRLSIITIGFLFLLLSACSNETSELSYNILAEAEDIPFLTTQALSIHSISQSDSLETQANGAKKLDGLYIYTLTVNDFYGEPFTNINFVAPRKFGNIWQFASSLTGNEWGMDDFDGDWFTILAGATDIRDTLISVSPSLGLLIMFNKTVEALGRHGKLDSIIATDYQNFVLKDKKGNLWSIEEQRQLTPEEVKSLTDMYDEVFTNMNTPEVSAKLKKNWKDLLAQSSKKQSEMGYSLANLADSDGSLSLQKAQTLMDSSIKPQYNTNYNDCFWFVCSVRQVGGMNPGKQVPFGGLKKSYYQYYPNTFPNEWFPTVDCLWPNGQTNAVLGCAPSAFIGLLVKKLQDGKTFAGMNKNNISELAFQQWLVAPVGFRNRTRIANYMGTCRATGTRESLTTGAGFRDGANNFLREANSDLKLISNISHYLGNETSAADKARMIVNNVGIASNPVIAEYFMGFGSGHYSAIEKYNIFWQGTVSVTIRTVDEDAFGTDPNRYWSLSGTWGTERGVFTLVKK